MKTMGRIKTGLTLFLCFVMPAAFVGCGGGDESTSPAFPVGTNPSGIAVDASGNLWVANQGVNTVTKLSSSGTLLNTFGVENNPGGIAIDSKGNVWVANFGSNNVAFLGGVAKGPEFSPYSGPIWP